MRLKLWQGGSPPVDAADEFADDLTSLYEAEAPRLRRRLGRRFTPDRAADLVQSAFVRLLRLGRERRDAIERPSAYLARTADNLARDHTKSATQRATYVTLDDHADLAVTADFQSALEARDLLRRIDHAIGDLPERTREIFMAHRFDNLTYGEIAAHLGISVKTVEKHISLALRALHRATGSER